MTVSVSFIPPHKLSSARFSGGETPEAAKKHNPHKPSRPSAMMDKGAKPADKATKDGVHALGRYLGRIMKAFLGDKPISPDAQDLTTAVAPHLARIGEQIAAVIKPGEKALVNGAVRHIKQSLTAAAPPNDKLTNAEPSEGAN